MAGITRIGSGAPWEPIFGYSRVTTAGGWAAVSGTTSFDERGLIVGKNQMYIQARQAIANIAAALAQAGMSLADVVRTRVFVTDITRFGEVARAHLEFFRAHPPASSVLEVRRLVHPDMLIEIEADAYVAPKAAAPMVDAAPIARSVSATKARVKAKPAAKAGKAPSRTARAKPLSKARVPKRR
jgi:enamine deaminase RidA (YjgF/YER057c/UK114 family)